MWNMERCEWVRLGRVRTGIEVVIGEGEKE